MFERFSLGNVETLRGWNKYEFAPLGGNRVAHVTVQTTRGPFTPFYDMGSVWDAGQGLVVRKSAGVSVGFNRNQCRGWKALNPLCYQSATVAFPIGGSSARPSLVVGFDFFSVNAAYTREPRR